jgi:hypothetical protein
MSVTATEAPAFPRLREIDRPSPRDAPVTRATFPERKPKSFSFGIIHPIFFEVRKSRKQYVASSKAGGLGLAEFGLAHL